MKTNCQLWYSITHIDFEAKNITLAQPHTKNLTQLFFAVRRERNAYGQGAGVALLFFIFAFHAVVLFVDSTIHQSALRVRTCATAMASPPHQSYAYEVRYRTDDIPMEWIPEIEAEGGRGLGKSRAGSSARPKVFMKGYAV